MDPLKLQKRFPLLKPFNDLHTEGYLFNFDNQLYEIPKHAITRDELELLRIFSGPLIISTLQDTDWHQYLTNQTNTIPAAIQDHRLLFLHFDKVFTDLHLLRTTLEALLGKEILLMSLNEHLFVVIEQITDDEPLIFTYFIHLLCEDLEAKLKIFVTDVISDITVTKARFSWLSSLQSSIWHHTSKHVLTQQELLIPYLTLQLDSQEKAIFSASILKEAVEHPDLLQTVKQVIQYEGNISFAAKKLFMHRNTLQNRLEKFHILTLKDIRQFEQRLEVFLAITLFESL
ncbi:sugar diacid utilization regulator [Lysinibacillus parviboronicapiens]|uniref:Sugar diacid utilization regulator n=1 Tax=Lysinibacillus parviboronicapiens TaxID=436516 RepID=A0ABV2PJK8_9BACI|nr:helix-turn-helix domain-containing protein [Lysinibacillus parviboronicapiens]